jgi:hypothetical protein
MWKNGEKIISDNGPNCGDARCAPYFKFGNPPDRAKPWVYWFPLDGNLTREGITADFEAMARVGIGGFNLTRHSVTLP